MPCTLQYNTIHTLQSNVPAFHTHYNAISPACHTHYSTTFMHLSIQRNAQPHTLQSNTPAQATPYNTMSLHRPHTLQCNTLHSHTHCQVKPLHNAQATQATAATGWFWDNEPASSGQGCSFTPLMFSTSITTITITIKTDFGEVTEFATSKSCHSPPDSQSQCVSITMYSWTKYHKSVKLPWHHNFEHPFG